MIIFLFLVVLLIIDYSFIQIENFYDDPILLFSHLLAIIFKYILLYSLIRIVNNRNNKFKYLNDNYSDNFFYFNKAFSNSTFTNTSLITILSGWNPSQNIGVAYNLETIFDKAKLFQNNKNFFFSSQDLNHSGFKFFFDSKSIDHIYHYENGNKDYSEINLSALTDEHIYDEYKS